MQAAVISEDYRRLQNALHASTPGYGVASIRYAPTVAKIVTGFDVHSLLDYGAGKGRLGMELVKLIKRPVRITPYDPAIPGWDAAPEPDELVCCIDVLEHIEPDRLDAVLDDLARLVRRLGFFTVHTGPAERILADGRNAHLIQEKPDWWLPRIMARFELSNFSKQPNGFTVLVLPLDPAAAK
jgi:hypothetical protein